MPVSVTGCASCPDSLSRSATSRQVQPPVWAPDTRMNAVMNLSSYAVVRGPGRTGLPRSPVR